MLYKYIVYTCSNKMLNHYILCRSYWSKNWPFNSHNFASLMSSRRFELILRFIHLNDSETQPSRGYPEFDKLYKIRPFLNIFLQSFRDSYTPSQNLSIDESMISFKGRAPAWERRLGDGFTLALFFHQAVQRA